MEFSRTTRKLRVISMVSLIDIVFTVILFMLVAGHIDKFSPVTVELPHADSGQRLDEGPIVVIISKYGDILINDVKVKGEKVGEQLKTELEFNPERVITIKADAFLEANQLVDFMESIRIAGGRNLSLVTQSGTLEVVE